jgi:hypothetical protein
MDPVKNGTDHGMDSQRKRNLLHGGALLLSAIGLGLLTDVIANSGDLRYVLSPAAFLADETGAFTLLNHYAINLVALTVAAAIAIWPWPNRVPRTIAYLLLGTVIDAVVQLATVHTLGPAFAFHVVVAIVLALGFGATSSEVRHRVGRGFAALFILLLAIGTITFGLQPVTQIGAVPLANAQPKYSILNNATLDVVRDYEQVTGVHLAGRGHIYTENQTNRLSLDGSCPYGSTVVSFEYQLQSSKNVQLTKGQAHSWSEAVAKKLRADPRFRQVQVLPGGLRYTTKDGTRVDAIYTTGSSAKSKQLRMWFTGNFGGPFDPVCQPAATAPQPTTINID